MNGCIKHKLTWTQGMYNTMVYIRILIIHKNLQNNCGNVKEIVDMVAKSGYYPLFRRDDLINWTWIISTSHAGNTRVCNRLLSYLVAHWILMENWLYGVGALLLMKRVFYPLHDCYYPIKLSMRIAVSHVSMVYHGWCYYCASQTTLINLINMFSH